MRVAIVTESFLPTLNGVTTSVCRVVDHLLDADHQVLIVCPSPAPTSYRGARVHTVPGITLRDFRVGVPLLDLATVLTDFRADVLHAASPFALGARGLAVARALGIPTVAVFQTDMATYLGQHAGPASRAVERATWQWLRRVHSLADLTLAPSSTCTADLERHGIPRVAQWGRGVDTDLFRPRTSADTAAQELRSSVAPGGRTVIGYVGRLAPEKQVHRLAELADLPDIELVVVGDGPSRARLERLLPPAHFLGYLQGNELAAAYAAFDVFVHTGTCETFGQTPQEAMAARLPVVAPAARRPYVAAGRPSSTNCWTTTRGSCTRRTHAGWPSEGQWAAFLALRKSLLSWLITSSGISLGHAAAHSPMFVQPPKPSASC